MAEFDLLCASVTGGASGIGAAVAEELRAAGARVAVLDLDPSSVSGDEQTYAVQCDVRDDASVRSAVESVAERSGGIDIVVNNAGIGAQGSVEPTRTSGRESSTSTSWASSG